MARRLYVKRRSEETDPVLELTLVLWVDVPRERQPEFANPTTGSAVENATAAELQALRAGALVERVVTLRWADDVPDPEIAKRVLEYAKHLRRELLGAATPRGSFWRAGMSYDPVTDTWSS